MAKKDQTDKPPYTLYLACENCHSVFFKELPWGTALHQTHSEENKRRETWIVTEAKQKHVELLLCQHCGTTSRLQPIPKKWYEDAKEKGFDVIEKMTAKNNVPQPETMLKAASSVGFDGGVTGYTKPQFIDL